MKPNYFTIHPNKKAKRIKYSKPYSLAQLKAMEQFITFVDKELIAFKKLLENKPLFKN